MSQRAPTKVDYLVQAQEAVDAWEKGGPYPGPVLRRVREVLSVTILQVARGMTNRQLENSDGSPACVSRQFLGQAEMPENRKRMSLEQAREYLSMLATYGSTTPGLQLVRRPRTISL